MTTETADEVVYSDNLILPQLTKWGPDEWRKDAKCKGVPSDIFFPERGNGNTGHKVAISKTICMGCPSRVPCLQFALDNHLTHGTYGGVAPHDRRAMAGKTVTYDMVKVSLKEAYNLMHRAKLTNVHERLAELMDKSPAWVRKELRNGGDHFI